MSTTPVCPDRCLVCGSIDPEVMQFAYPVYYEFNKHAVCETCFLDCADDIKQCDECLDHALTWTGEDIYYSDCCRVWICADCWEDHEEAHTDPYTLRGLSRKDFI